MREGDRASVAGCVPADPPADVPHDQHTRRAGCISRVTGCGTGTDPAPGATAGGAPGPGPTPGVATPAGLPSVYGSPVVAGVIETDDIKESSGLSASECQDVLWTHNDSGNEALIYAMSTEGKHLGTWPVVGAQNVNWESITPIRTRAATALSSSATPATTTDTPASRALPRPRTGRIHRDGHLEQPGSAPDRARETMRFSYPDGSNDAKQPWCIPGPVTSTL